MPRQQSSGVEEQPRHTENCLLAEVAILTEGSTGPRQLGAPLHSATLDLFISILALATGTNNAEPLAQSAIRKFGSISQTFAAKYEDLLKVPGFGSDAALLIKLLYSAANRLLRAKITDTPFLDDRQSVNDYLRSLLARESVEHLWIFFLNSSDRLLSGELFSKGTINHVPVSVREIVRRARELGATRLVLAHNHPSGDPSPSTPDLELTRDVHKAASIFGISVSDHVIVGSGRPISLLESNFMTWRHDIERSE